MTNLLLIFTTLFLLFLNAFFVASEFAMVKIRHTRVEAIKTSHGFRGKILSYVHKHLDAYLSACQLGITLASLGLGWVGEPLFAHLLEPVFNVLSIISPNVIKVFSFIIAFSLLSFLHIVVGELMPKSMAIRQAEKISLWTAVPLYIFYWAMYPAIWVLNSCAILLLKLTRLGGTHPQEYFYSTDEIKLILSGSHLHGELSKYETEILEQTLDFADLKVTEVMRPYEEMVMLNSDQVVDDMLKIVAETRYSRYPIYDKRSKSITGIVHVKDLFSALYHDKLIESIEPLMRPVLKVNSRTSALDLLRQLREGMPHFALVYRSDTLLGFVTLDNLLHVLIGRIKDEFHRTQDDWITHSDGSLTVRGSCPIASLERALDRDITMSQEEEAEVLTGLILNKLGRLPTEGETLQFNDFKAVIKKMNGVRITKIKIYPKPNKREE